MPLEAHITVEGTQPWLYITQPGAAQGERFCVFDAPLDLRTKRAIKAEIEWAHERSGMSRPDLYDVFRSYQQSVKRGEEAVA